MKDGDRDIANRAYWGEICKLMAKTQELLRAEWPEDVFNTYDLAVCIESLRSFRKHRGQPQRRKITPLESSAKKFLAELADHRRALLDSIPPELIENGYYRADLAKVDDAQSAVSVFLEKPQPFNVAQEMGRRLLDTCTRASVPLSAGTKEDDPYCRLVTALLGLGGIHKGLWTVSDMLRGRTSRRRSGKPKYPDRAQKPENRARAEGAKPGKNLPATH